jgi:hypothetical protein
MKRVKTMGLGQSDYATNRRSTETDAHHGADLRLIVPAGGGRVSMITTFRLEDR